ncbi:hypothetical protein R1sor_026630 [Riccia sorocarpa]|uniref:Fucosyltransferase n=1 Tax=Riccia sorocarpa TaxID=122646 RepID=A0ABD3GBX0_9MARC
MKGSSFGSYMSAAVLVFCSFLILLCYSLDLSPTILAQTYWTVRAFNGFETINSTFPNPRELRQSSSLDPEPKPDSRIVDWKEWADEWWKDSSVNPGDRNWEGRQRLHDFLKKWNPLAHNSGLLSATHLIMPILLMGVFKGDGYTVIPVARPRGAEPGKTFDGCGEPKDMHIGCFFNLTNCRPDADPVRLKILQSRNETTQGAHWDSLWTDTTTAPGGMTLLTGFVSKFPRPAYNDVWKAPKLQLWKEVQEHGKIGVHVGTDGAVQEPLDSQIDFALHGMLSAWMMRQTTDRVKKIAEDIMSRYSDDNGRPLWTPPVLAIHIRQTDKKAEDPYFMKHHRYRSVDEYIERMKSFEDQFDFRWESLLIMSDSGSALQSLAVAINNVTGSPDSMNGQAGKRFIMYDWNFDNSMIESRGGHENIPPNMKRSAQEHFLATLYITSKIADYAVVSYSSNVGRFMSEIISGRQRLATSNSLGPIALSLDYSWAHN